MRSLLATFLAGLLFACPILCGADEIGHVAQHGHSPGSPDDADAPGDDCPENSDNCVCRGATPSTDARSIAQDFGLSPLVLPFDPAPLAAHLLPHPTGEGAPHGLSGRGDALTVRALLQNFRF